MDKIIATVFLIIGTVTGSVLLTNSVLPAIAHTADSLREAQYDTAERIRTSIDILIVEQDPDDSDSLIFWVKNVGSTRIGNIQDSDLFVDTPQGTELLSYGTASLPSTWSYCLESQPDCLFGTVWKPAVTMKVTITMANLVPGNYTALLVLPLGVQAQMDFIV